jgi:3-hydroxyacyl-CoA dehydrogenase
LARIEGTTSIDEAAKDADLTIEAVSENLKLKKDILNKLDENALLHAVLASNTSFWNISEMASFTKKAGEGCGNTVF